MGQNMGSGVARLDSIAGMNRRRPLVLLFTDIANSTALAALMEPEDYADLLTAIRSALQDLMEQYSGQIIRVDGDGALCMFGFSQNAEHAGKDAAMAALAFHAEVAAIARKRGLDALNMHSGIHAGMVLLRTGDLVRGRYEVIGDVTNIAARLCDAAGADDILISADALGPDASHFALAARRDVVLPSDASHKVRRIAAYPVLGPGNIRQIEESRNSAPIFGRDAEIDLARQWLQHPAAEAPVFYIQAEAGGGKSRLLTAIVEVAAAAGLNILRGQCEEEYLAAPLQPMAQLTANMAIEHASSSDQWALQQAMRLAIVDRAREGPIVMVIDDWQWADDATKRVVEQILATASGQIRLLVASRTNDAGLLGRRPEWTIGLPPLPKAAATAMVSAIVPHFDPQRARKIHSLSGGNPLLIEELCRDPEFAYGDASDGKVSFRVAAVVERRVAALPADVVHWLDHISVCVGPIPVWILAELTGQSQDAIDAMLQKLATIDFLHQEVRGVPRETLVRFRHALLKQAVQDRLSPDRRRALHRTIADFILTNADRLRNDGRKEQLAHHLLSSDNALGLDYALSAGKAAMQAGSLDRAVGQYRRAITFAHRNRNARDEVAVLRLANRFGAAVLLDPHVEHFAPLSQLHTIAEQQGLSSIKGRLLYWQASLHYATGRPDEAKAVLAMPDFASMFEEAGLPTELVTGLQGQLGVLMAQHRRAACQMDSAIAGLEAKANPAYDNSLAYMLLMRAQLRGEQGYFADAARDFDRAEQLMQGKDMPLYASTLVQKAGVALWAEDYAKVRDYAAAGLNHGDRVGSRYYAMLSRALDAAAWGHMGGGEEALAEMEHCLRWSTHTQSGYTLSIIHSWAAELSLRLGDTMRAADHAHLCIAQGRHRLYWGAAEAWRVRAVLAEDEALALRALSHGYVHARRMGSIREWAATLAAHAAIAMRFGDVAKARRLKHQADIMRRSMGLPMASPRLAMAESQPKSESIRAAAV